MDLRKSKYIIPNSFTLTSVFLGLLAVIWAAGGHDGDMKKAAVAIVIAMLADMMDGRVARLTKTQSNFGVQMDSLADAISFGLVPAAVAGLYGVKDIVLGGVPVGIVAMFVYLAAGVMRLARFNITAGIPGKATGNFEGLPIPGGAGAVATLIWVSQDLALPRMETAVFLTLLMPVLGILMISRIRYVSFKHVKWGWYKRAAALLTATTLVLVAIKTQMSLVLFGVATLYAASGPCQAGLRLVSRLRGCPEDITEQDNGIAEDQ